MNNNDKAGDQGPRSIEAYRRRQGKKAQAFGVLFERMFENSCQRTGIAITRMPDGCRQIGNNQLLRVRTPFDWICSHKGRAALIDTKTTMTSNFAHSMITDHQVHSLLHHEIAGSIAGYVIWLREANKIIFIRASVLAEMMRYKGSISWKHPEAIQLGDSIHFDVLNLFEYQGEEDTDVQLPSGPERG